MSKSTRRDAASEPAEDHRLPRGAGILLHPTSLPGRYGIGDLGPEAFQFVDQLAAAKQRYWQILPLAPPGLGNSPYAAQSAFAGNPLLISLDLLVDQGWLTAAEAKEAEIPAADRIDFERVSRLKSRALERAYLRARALPDWNTQLTGLQERHGGWVDDYALYRALQEAHSGSEWLGWETPYRRREPDALDRARKDLADAIDRHRFEQLVFFTQWSALKQHANRHDIQIIGDIPIFVAHDSSDVWVNQDLFHLDEEGAPTVVAGVPPDLFSATGQRWGNPLYDWKTLANTEYAWWVERLRMMLDQVDVIRFDHFRGFESYWEIQASEETAKNGKWVKGPGTALFDAIGSALGPVPIVVEDLGDITPEVIALRDALGFPGMKVLQFGFGGDERNPPDGTNPYLPHNYERGFVVYTGTHDNDTTHGWFASGKPFEREGALSYTGSDGRNIGWDFIRLAYTSVADIAIAPLQDVLALGSEARMNFPGKGDNQWSWRLRSGQLTEKHVSRLARLAALTDRVVRTQIDAADGEASSTAAKEETGS